MNQRPPPAILLLACWALCLSTMAATKVAPAQTPKAEKLSLQIGIPLSRQPYAYLDKNKQPAGVLVNLIQHICQQIQATCTFGGGETEQLITDLQAIKLNAVLITDDFLMPAVDKLKLTQPLCKPEPEFIQKAHQPARSKPEDFRGKTIAVQEGSIFHVYLLDEYNSQSRLIPYPFMSNAVFDLVVGRVDALFAEEAFVQTQILDTGLNGYIDFSKMPIEMADIPATAMTLAVREQDSELATTLETALSKMPKEQTCLQLFPDDKQNKPKPNH